MSESPLPRGWGWLWFAPTLLLVVAGVWFLYSLSWTVGASPGDKVITRGTAEIASCHRNALHLWLVHQCDAEITLADAPGLPRPEQRAAAETAGLVVAAPAVSGRIDVELIAHGARTADNYTVVPVDRPDFPSGMTGYLWVVMFPGLALLAGLGVFATHRLVRLVPKAAPSPKDWRGVSARRPAGPKRAKRRR